MRSSKRKKLFQEKNNLPLSYIKPKFVHVWNHGSPCTSSNMIFITGAVNCIKLKIQVLQDQAFTSKIIMQLKKGQYQNLSSCLMFSKVFWSLCGSPVSLEIPSTTWTLECLGRSGHIISLWIREYSNSEKNMQKKDLVPFVFGIWWLVFHYLGKILHLVVFKTIFLLHEEINTHPLFSLVAFFSSCFRVGIVIVITNNFSQSGWMVVTYSQSVKVSVPL